MAKRKKEKPASAGHNTAGLVLSFVERIEKLEADIKALRDDQTEVLNQAESQGLDKRILKTVVKVRKNKQKFEEDLMIVDTYLSAIGNQLNFDFGSINPFSSIGEEDREAA